MRKIAADTGKRPSQRARAVTALITIAVIMLLVITSPVQAVQLNLSADTSTADQGDIVGFDLGINVETGERVPFDNVTIVIDGPETVACTFALDGSGLDGCEDFVIFRTNDFSPFGYGYNFGYGFDGSSTHGTEFGYGYGYGYASGAFSGADEFFYRVLWNTSDADSGDYTVTFFTTARLNDIERTFNLEEAQNLTITGPTVPPGNETAPAANLIVTDVDGRTVSFLCEDNFDATTFDWFFGDGSAIIDTTSDTQTHTYAADGTYTVSCTATAEDGTTRIDVETVTVEDGGVVVPPPTGDDTSVNLFVKEHYPQGADYVFVCDAQGYDADTYDWNFGDGESLTDVENREVFHTYHSNGQKTVFCAATGEGITEEDTLIIDVSGAITPPPEPEPEGDINLVRDRINDSTFRFTCETPNWTPDAYDWEVYNGEELLEEFDVENRSIVFTFDRDGKFVVSCTATNQQQTLIDWMWMTVDVEEDLTVVDETPEGERDAPATEITVDADSATLKVLPGASNDILLRILTAIEKRIDLSALLVVSGSEASATMPITAEFLAQTSSGDIDVRVPAGITVTGPSTWDGTMILPRIVNTSATLPDGATLGTAVVIGADGVDLTFDKGVRIRLDGRAGETVAYVEDGALVEIDDVCSADTQLAADALPAGGDCRIDVGGDLVVWTKHFTEFVTYTESAPQEQSSGSSSSRGSGGGGGGGYFTTKEAFWGTDDSEVAEEEVVQPEDMGERRFEVDSVSERLADAPQDSEEEAPSASPITGLAASSGGSSGGWIALALLAGVALAALALVIIRRR